MQESSADSDQDYTLTSARNGIGYKKNSIGMMNNARNVNV